MSSYNTSSPHGDKNSNPNPNLTESKAHKVSSYSNSSTQGDINKQTERPTLKLRRGGLRLLRDLFQNWAHLELELGAFQDISAHWCILDKS